MWTDVQKFHLSWNTHCWQITWMWCVSSDISTFNRHKYVHNGIKQLLLTFVIKRLHAATIWPDTNVFTAVNVRLLVICVLWHSVMKAILANSKHKRIHSIARPFTCDICYKAFTHSSSLSRHKRIHSRERPYICDVCLMTFTEVRTLDRHKRSIHSNERL